MMKRKREKGISEYNTSYNKEKLEIALLVESKKEKKTFFCRK